MKLRAFLVCVFLMLCVVSAYTESPIEVIYLKPSDVKMPSQAEIESLRDVMTLVQAWYGSEMERHGFGPKTFSFNRETTVIDGKLKRSQYTGATIHREISLIEWGFQNQIYVVFLGGDGLIEGSSAFMKPLCVPPADPKHCNGMVVVSADNKLLLEPLLAHELGHAFSLFDHAPTRLIKNRIDVMYAPLHVIPGIKEHLKNYAFSQVDAAFLNKDGRLAVQQAPVGNFHQGIDADVNNDGYVDLSDVLIVRSAIGNRVPYDTDVNNDGKTDETDVLLVKAKAHEAIAAAAPSLYRRKRITTWGDLKRR